jgi:hypothetical protein
MVRDGWMDGVERTRKVTSRCSAVRGVVFKTPSPPTQFRLSKSPTNLRCAKGPRRKVRRTNSTPTILLKSTKEGIRLSSSSTNLYIPRQKPLPRAALRHIISPTQRGKWTTVVRRRLSLAKEALPYSARPSLGAPSAKQLTPSGRKCLGVDCSGIVGGGVIGGSSARKDGARVRLRSCGIKT